jgi:DNA processing protein
MRENEIRKISKSSSNYSVLLREIPGPPEVLYAIGDEGLLNGKAVAIVGTRNASEYGRWACGNIARELAENDVIVVSGMARGIDTAAHEAALAAGGKTIAVLAGGADKCYPMQNIGLYKEIKRQGLILAENEAGTAPLRQYFPARNRIISGLSIATLVIEAGIKSGSIITAEFANEQGRPVYALPGNINKQSSAGCNKLIKDGVSPIISFADIINELGIKRKPTADEKEKLSRKEFAVLRAIRNEGEARASLIAEKEKIDISEALGIVTVLEMKGFVATELGRVFAV